MVSAVATTIKKERPVEKHIDCPVELADAFLRLLSGLAVGVKEPRSRQEHGLYTREGSAEIGNFSLKVSIGCQTLMSNKISGVFSVIHQTVQEESYKKTTATEEALKFYFTGEYSGEETSLWLIPCDSGAVHGHCCVGKLKSGLDNFLNELQRRDAIQREYYEEQGCAWVPNYTVKTPGDHPIRPRPTGRGTFSPMNSVWE